VNGRAFCNYHQQWHEVEDFDWTSYQSGDACTSRLRVPKTNCRLAEETVRDLERQTDPARAAVVSRSKRLANDLTKALGHPVGYQWVMIELNRRALIPILRALLGPDGLCLNCGYHQTEAKQYEIEHRFPPRSMTDWPAQHARNLWLSCPGCNRRKGSDCADRDWLESEQRKWMIDREWSRHAGEDGWPPLDSAWPVVDVGEWSAGTLFRPWE
jgi:5-methylcytosine-specific restriction endonuclease McrA